MSRKAPKKTPASPPKAASRRFDRRVRRTRDVLGEALIGLMHEKPFEAITVQQVIDRANVGRSTFYTHYRDKDDLFLSDVEDFFEGVATLLSRRGETSNRVAPVRELFAHVADARELYATLIAAGKINDVMELGQGHFARAIEQRLAELSPDRPKNSMPRAATAHALAGALLSLMSWWIDHEMAGSPAQMDDLYHEMVWFGVSGPNSKP
ncbi:MAG TPA: TetR/AcrR family transcriptional regulator [Terriglobales bacterium]|nr:TetR/AcrR family transcriptional regulator [Terriglobales bacterium]